MIQKVSSQVYHRRYYLESDGIDFYQQGVVPPKIEKAFTLARVKKEMTIVDVGCGRGDFIYAALKEGVKLIGIDYSQEAMTMSSSLRETLSDAQRRLISLVQADGTELPLRTQSVNTIFLMDVIEHLYPDQLQQCLKGCTRALREGGRVIIHTSPNRWYNDFGYPFWERPFNRLLNRLFRQQLLDRPIRRKIDLECHVNEQTVVTLRQELQRCGLKSKVWLGVEYLLPVKKETILMQLLEITRQTACHLFPFSLTYPLKALFSNDIWAVGEK